MKRWARYILIVLNCVAIALSASVFIRAKELADAAIDWREEEFVEQVKPKSIGIDEDFDMKLTLEEQNLQTLDGRIKPMIRLVQDVT